eukprot:3627257-Pleurochrysis_carterae.AAC.2
MPSLPSLAPMPNSVALALRPSYETPVSACRTRNRQQRLEARLDSRVNRAVPAQGRRDAQHGERQARERAPLRPTRKARRV